MHMQAEIIELGTESYQGKRGLVKLPVLTLLDRTKGVRLKNTVDMILTEEQSAKLPTHENGKLVGQPVEVGINDIRAGFAGRSRVSGEILSLNGKSL